MSRKWVWIVREIHTFQTLQAKKKQQRDESIAFNQKRLGILVNISFAYKSLPYPIQPPENQQTLTFLSQPGKKNGSFELEKETVNLRQNAFEMLFED